MVELATKILVGAKLKRLGYGTGLYPNSPYVAVKVPVFSFEKLNDVNLAARSRDEVHRRGARHRQDDRGGAVQGLVSAGFNMKHPTKQHPSGIYFTVNDQE